MKLHLLKDFTGTFLCLPTEIKYPTFTLVKIIECPRDAMQGIKSFIPTAEKVLYLKSLLPVGVHTIDIGSFVSPKYIPQMQDTASVLDMLAPFKGGSLFLVIVANLRGAEEAIRHSCVDYLGYPFSISEKFQMRNTHKTISESLKTLEGILDIAHKCNKIPVTYLSMGFGNPYGDPWSLNIVEHWTETLVNMGINVISLSDTTGNGLPEDIANIFNYLIPRYPQVEFGAHLHAATNNWYDKLNAAYEGGCRRFEGTIMGFGGCPMAKDKLTGNIPTEKIITFLRSKNEDIALKMTSFEGAYNKATALFNTYC